MSDNAERANLTRSEAAELLDVDPASIDRWAIAGQLPYWTTPGGQKRFRRADIEAILTPVEPTTAAS